MPRWVYFFGQGQADGSGALKHLVGGKGASLADMSSAGLNVPPGFTISAECCDYYHRNGQHWPDGLDAEIRANLARLEQLTGRSFGAGDPPLLLAVRSGAARSMPGMMDTVLNVGLPETGDPWSALCAAINAVFASWHSERAVTYRRHHQIDDLLGTAVTIQAMCPSEVAGVLFTANPVNAALRQIVIESARGLGEALVLGKVTPDRFVLDRDGLAIVERHLAPHESGAAALNDEQVQELGRLGLRVEAYFGHPCDIEWGLAAGQFYLLQSRAILFSTATAPAVDAADREQVRAEEIAALRTLTEPGGTVWSRFNLYEILPEPTPMTWAIVRRFMSGQGGYGLMYRDLGFDPDPALDATGTFDLVCGRPYCNLSREPRMQYRSLPFEHPFALLKKNPQKAMYPQAIFNPARAGWRFWMFLPLAFVKLMRSGVRMTGTSRDFADRFEQHIVPPFLAEVEGAERACWTDKSDAELLALLEHWTRRTLVDFARDSLKPTVLAAVAMGNLERSLTRRLAPAGPVVPTEDGQLPGMKAAQEALRRLVMGVRPAEQADLAGGLRALREGRLSMATFLERFGHRGSQEMELARPRWSEEHADLERIAGGDHAAEGAKPQVADAWEEIAAAAKLAPHERTAVEAELRTLHRYLGLREAAKHYMLRGYALIRRALVELDRRHRLSGAIFFLHPDELPRLTTGGESARVELLALAAKRKHRRAVALSLPVPQVIFSDDLDAIGRDVTADNANVLQGVPLSAGQAEAKAWVLETSTAAELPDEPYILVCPSTDPAWLPLFVHARGLVMETGGVLSHGAIVARDFGLPAVAGIADVHRRLKTGQRLRIDGATGQVEVLA